MSINQSQVILNSPLNTSKSKFQYSFSKSQRFRKSRTEQSQSFFYDVNYPQQKRAAGIGYGQKFDFTPKKIIAPEPTKYQIESLFNENKRRLRGNSFKGSGHQSIDSHYVPGPGTYQVQKPKGTCSFSIRPRTLDPWIPIFLRKPLKNEDQPGPGRYDEYKTISRDRRPLVSKYTSSGSTVLNFSSQRQQIQQLGQSKVGPGEYQLPDSFNDSNHYINSKFKANGKRLFPCSKRFCFIDETVKKSLQQKNKKYQVPGPGNYKQPSDFGIYEKIELRPSTTDNFSKLKGGYERGNSTFTQKL